MADYVIQFFGSVCVAVPQHDEAEDFLLDAMGDEAQWFGAGVVVEPRYVGGLVEDLANDGWYVEMEGMGV